MRTPPLLPGMGALDYLLALAKEASMSDPDFPSLPEGVTLGAAYLHADDEGHPILVPLSGPRVQHILPLGPDAASAVCGVTPIQGWEDDLDTTEHCEACAAIYAQAVGPALADG